MAFYQTPSQDFSVCSCGELSDKCSKSDCVESKSLLFTVCDLCKTEILSAKYEDHIMRHRVKYCLGCKSTEVVELIGHITKDHFNCPLCNSEQYNRANFLYHLDSIHHFEWHKQDCEGCQDLRLPHFPNKHYWNVCPCGRHIAPGYFLEHLQMVHAFRECKDCPKTADGLIANLEHVKEHLHVECYCGKKVQQRLLGFHLEDSHGWYSCKYCNHAEGTVEKLNEHEKSDHSFFDCTECHETFLEEQKNIHLCEIHGWKLCPWCPISFPEDNDIHEHIEKSHPATVKCTVCSYKDTFTRLQQHMSGHHEWQLCQCNRAIPIVKPTECLQCSNSTEKLRATYININNNLEAVIAVQTSKGYKLQRLASLKRRLRDIRRKLGKDYNPTYY